MTEQNNAPETTAVSPLAALPSSELLREASAEDLRVLVCLLAGTSAAPAALAKAARKNDAVTAGKQLVHGGIVDFLGIHPVDIHLYAVFKARMLQGFCHRQVSVMQTHILAN